jgi:pectinesterase
VVYVENSSNIELNAIKYPSNPELLFSINGEKSGNIQVTNTNASNNAIAYNHGASCFDGFHETETFYTKYLNCFQSVHAMMKKVFSIIFLFFLAIPVAFSQAGNITVAQDGSGNYRTVQEAINALKDSNTQETMVYIKNGIYKEKLRLPESKTNVHLIGESVDKTILTYDDYASKKDSAGKDIGTSGSASFFVFGSGFTAENITFENSSGAVGQAVAVRVTGDKAKFFNCRFLGFQDTLYTHGDNSRQYYYKCYIEGTVDFIFGWSTALFDSCIIYGKRGGFYTAASTPENKKFGYVFINCKITGDAPASSFYLGRPWRPYAKTVFINCYLDRQVMAEGWNNWSNAANEKTAFYAEYNNHGEGASTNGRVPWSHQLTAAEAKEYTLANILSGWNPVHLKH